MQSHFSKQNKKKLSHIKWFCRWAVGAGLFVLILFRFCFRPPSIRRQILCLNLNGKFTTILIFLLFCFVVLHNCFGQNSALGDVFIVIYIFIHDIILNHTHQIHNGWCTVGSIWYLSLWFLCSDEYGIPIFELMRLN